LPLDTVSPSDGIVSGNFNRLKQYRHDNRHRALDWVIRVKTTQGA
jgi:hypothetical protein